MKSSIYKITHIPSERFYIGSAKNTKERWRVHIKQLQKNEHHSKFLQRLYNKYGQESLLFQVLEYCDVERLIEREQYYLDKLSPPLNSYKVAGSPLGYKHSEETRRKLSEAHKGRKVVFSEEGWANILAALKRPKSIEHRKKISDRAKERGCEHLRKPEIIEKVAAFHRGRKRSKETKEKISKALVGKKMNDAARVAMIERMRSPKMREHLSMLAKKGPPTTKGKKLNLCEEQRLRMSQIRKGVPLSEEHKRKIRESCAKGFTHTDEAKKKIAESKRRFTNEQALEIRQHYNSGLTIKELCNMYKANKNTISRVIKSLSPYF